MRIVLEVLVLAVSAWVVGVLIAATVAPVRIGSWGEYGDIYVQCGGMRR